MPLTSVTTCPICDHARPAGATEGHCPACLWKMTLGADEEESDGEEAPWNVLGDHELFEEIGRGGMGIIYRARQRSLRRIVAVKVLRGAEFAGQPARARFRREAAAAARLHHPGIVAIHDVGETEGVLWFSMDFVPGENLDQHVRERPLEARAAARIVARIAEAVQHAHEHGVLHRDLKPSNILLAGDQPRITDFGIARQAATDSEDGGGTLTQTGQLLGSPGYAAPEQVIHGEADARTDVYGLGAVLYHLLTGRPPFQGPTLDSIVLQLRDSDPVSPRRLNPTVPRDLETICLRALQKNPAQRYASASEFAEDVQRFCEGRTIHARPASPIERLWRWARRKPAVAALSAAIVLAVALGGGAIFSQMRRAQTAETAALREARDARGTAYRSDVRLANQELVRGRSPAYELLASDPALIPPGAGWEWRFLQARARQPLWEFSAPRGGTIYSARFSPDGSRFAACGVHGEVWIWETGTRLLVRTIQAHQGPVGGIAWHPDGQRIASAGEDGTAKIWDATTGELQQTLASPRECWVLSWSPDGARLAVGGFSDELSVWDVAAGKKVGAWPAPGGIGGGNWNPRSPMITVLRNGGDARIHLLDAAHALAEQTVPLPEASDAVWHPGGELMAVATRQGHILVVDPARNYAVLWEQQTGRGTASSIEFTRDGERLLVGNFDGMLQVWDWKKDRLISTLAAHRATIERIAAWDDLILTNSFDGKLRLWALPDGPAARTEIAAGGTVRTLNWTATGDTLQAVVVNEAADTERDVAFPQWRIQTHPAALPEIAPRGDVPLGAWSPDGRRLAIIAEDGELSIRDSATGKITLESGIGKPSHDVSWSPRGDRCVCFDPFANPPVSRLYDLSAGRTTGIIPTCPVLLSLSERALPHAWSPDGRRLLMSAGTMLYDTTTGAAIAGWPKIENGLNQETRITAWSWHRDGRQVATGRAAGVIEIRDAATGSVLRARQIHSGLVSAVQWHPTEPRLATCGRDGVVRVLDAETLEELISLPDHGADVRAIAWSPDGEQLASGGADRRILIWDVRPAPYGSARIR